MADVSESVGSQSTMPVVFIRTEDVNNISNFMTANPPIHISEPTYNLRSLIGSTIFCSIILLANIVSLLAFWVEKKLRTYNNYFIINLSILDLVVGIGLAIALEHSYVGHYPYPQDACKIITGIFNGIVNASNFNVVIICVDRHQAVYDPINHFITRSKRKAAILCSLPWLIGLSFWVGYVTVWEFVIDWDNGLHCTQRFFLSPLTNMIQSSSMFFLPLVVIAVLYLRIFVKIRKTVGRPKVKKMDYLQDARLSSAVNSEMTLETVSSASVSGAFSDIQDTRSGADTMATAAQAPKEKNASNIGQDLPTPTSHRMESSSEMAKATRTLLLIVISFLIAWIPISIINLLYSIEPRLIIPGLPTQAFTVFVNMQYANSLLNPISYAMSQPLFRATVIKMLSCRRK